EAAAMDIKPQDDNTMGPWVRDIKIDTTEAVISWDGKVWLVPYSHDEVGNIVLGDWVEGEEVFVRKMEANMDFEKWLEKHGIDKDSCDEDKLAVLKKCFDDGEEPVKDDENKDDKTPEPEPVKAKEQEIDVLKNAEAREKVAMQEKIDALEAKLSETTAKVDAAEDKTRKTEITAFVDGLNADGKISHSEISYKGKDEEGNESADLCALMEKMDDESLAEFKMYLSARPKQAKMNEDAEKGDEE
ncbi:unnamed protein product, partial [marine sediment metagenome]